MKRKYLRVVTVLELIVFLSVSSFAWFSDKSTPSISENQIKVSSAEGLVIKLDPDSEARVDVSLNDILVHYDLFELKQISSADANDFYYIDFGQGLSQGNPQFVKVTPELDGSIDMLLYGYIDYDFYLQTGNIPKHVYFHKDTDISGTAADALRIAVSITEGTTTTTRIFGTTKENGITYPFTTEAIVAEGYFEFSNIASSFIDNQVVELISERDGGRGTSDDDPVDLNKLLVDIPANTQVQVNIKIWLEGGDEDCLPTIADSMLDVMVKFGSANILLDAPTLTANNSTMTITGLTTDMEYSSDQIVWTSVTDSNMTFSAAETVYVRIAEVPDISPESYITTVIFD